MFDEERDTRLVSHSQGMTNADVLKLVEAGFGEQVIINAIRQEPRTAFDISMTGLIALKNSKVPDGFSASLLVDRLS